MTSCDNGPLCVNAYGRGLHEHSPFFPKDVANVVSDRLTFFKVWSGDHHQQNGSSLFDFDNQDLERCYYPG